MKNLTTITDNPHQAILEEGKAEEARKMLLLMGRVRFGEPSAKIAALLDAVTDLGRLEALAIRLLHVKTWEELLGVNGTARPAPAEKGVNNALAGLGRNPECLVFPAEFIALPGRASYPSRRFGRCL